MRQLQNAGPNKNEWSEQYCGGKKMTKHYTKSHVIRLQTAQNRDVQIANIKWNGN